MRHRHHHRHHSKSTYHTPEQIFQYADIYRKKPYQIYFRFFSQDFTDVDYLRKKNIIPADVPIFNSEAAIKLHYADEASLSKVGICILSCCGSIGLIITVITLTFMIIKNLIGLIGMLVFGIVLMLFGLLLFFSFAKDLCTKRNKYIRPYICHTMPKELKETLENEAAENGEQFYQQLIQYNQYHPECYYVSQILLTVNNIKQGICETRVLGRQVLTQNVMQEAVSQPIQPIYISQPVQSPIIQQQTVSNEAINQQQVAQEISLPNQEITHITAPPVL